MKRWIWQCLAAMCLAVPAFAQGDGSPGTGAPQGIMGLFTGIAPFLFIFVFFYVLIIRPQRQREKKHKELLESLKKGDLVVTSGGLHGSVEGFSDDGKVLHIKIAEGVTVKVLRSAVNFLKKGDELIETASSTKNGGF